MTPASGSSSFKLAPFLRRHALLPLIAGGFLALLAPFGTGHFSLIGLIGFWVGLSFAGGFGALGARAAQQKWWPRAADWLIVLIMSMGATLAVSPFVLTIFAAQDWPAVPLSLFYVFIISAAISGVGYLSEKAQLRSSDTPPKALRPALMDRLPPNLRDATLLAITSEDHYVRLFTDAGEHLTLMRLSDAEDLAKPLAGLKPHRSWWVAEAGVDTISRKGGKLLIVLKSGQVVPVSRSGAKLVREANWI